MISNIDSVKFININVDKSNIIFENNKPVFIIGKNGCGKTRFIKLLQHIFMSIKNIRLSNKQFIAKYNYPFCFSISFDVFISIRELNGSTFEIKRVEPTEKIHEYIFGLNGNNDVNALLHDMGYRVTYSYNCENKLVSISLYNNIIHVEKSIQDCAIKFNKLPKEKTDEFFSHPEYLSDLETLNFCVQLTEILNNNIHFHFADKIPKLIQENYNDVRKYICKINNILLTTFNYFNIHILNDTTINNSENNELIFMYTPATTTNNNIVHYIPLNYSDTSSSFQTIVYYLYLILNENKSKLFLIDEFDQQLDKNTLAKIINVFLSSEHKNNQIIAVLQNPFSITSQIKNYYIVYDYNKLQSLTTTYEKYLNVSHFREFLIGDYKKFIIVEGEIDTYLIKSVYKSNNNNPDELCIVQTDSKSKMINLIDFLDSIHYFENMVKFGIKILLIYDKDENDDSTNEKIKTMCNKYNFNYIEHDKNLEDNIVKNCEIKHYKFIDCDVNDCKIISTKCNKLNLTNASGQIYFINKSSNDGIIEHKFNDCNILLSHNNIKINIENYNSGKMTFESAYINNLPNDKTNCNHCILLNTNDVSFSIKPNNISDGIDVTDSIDAIEDQNCTFIFKSKKNKYNDRNIYTISKWIINSCNINILNEDLNKTILMECTIDQHIANITKILHEIKEIHKTKHKKINADKLSNSIDTFISELCLSKLKNMTEFQINSFKDDFYLLKESFMSSNKINKFKEVFKNQLRKYVLSYDEHVLNEKVFGEFKFHNKYCNLAGLFEINIIKDLKFKILNI
jgi:energy-coupling factor transporter ATP-binding protein EcfA2